LTKKAIWISAAIALVVAIPGVSAFADPTPTAAPSSQPTVQSDLGSKPTPEGNNHFGRKNGGHESKDDKGGKGGKGGESGLDKEGGSRESAICGGHGQEYLQLLTEKYAPEQSSAFKAAYDQRNQLEAQLKALKDANKPQMDAKNAELKKSIADIQAKVTSGELTQAQAKEQIKQLTDAQKGVKPEKAQPTAEQKAQMEASKQLQTDFDAAVKALIDNGSTDAIKTVLPKLLDELKTHNQQLSDRLAQMNTAPASK
jgi:hypothetical protein